MKILIDADGCPVVDHTIDVANSYDIQCVIVCDTAHSIDREGAQTIVVSCGADSVDFALLNILEKGDIVVTQDYGLAALCIAKHAMAISQDGLVFCDDNIDHLLYQRYSSQKTRKAGIRLKGPKKRTNTHNLKFIENLDNLIKQNKEV